MGRCMELECAKVWATVVRSLSMEQIKFALNAALDTLPHNANLYLLQKKSSSPYLATISRSCMFSTQ